MGSIGKKSNGERADAGEVAPKGLPEITYRQLEVFSVTCREQSYANAALELHSTRANIKRVCQDFERAIGRPLFEERPGHALVPTPFANGLLGQVGPLSRSLRNLGEGVRGLHQEGRILRFAAAGEFFRGGLFTDFLATLKTSDLFRACYVRIEVKRFRTALLNAECDVYFGLGLGGADRLDPVDLGPVPWKIVRPPKARGKAPGAPGELGKGPWWIAGAGEAEVAGELLEAFRRAGARGGNVAGEEERARLTGDPAALPADACLLVPDMAAGLAGRIDGSWPCYRLTACLRRNHPYAELKPRLLAAARECGHGH